MAKVILKKETSKKKTNFFSLTSSNEDLLTVFQTLVNGHYYIKMV